MSWGRNKYSRPLPTDCVPFENVWTKKGLKRKALSWHREWFGWKAGRQSQNEIDRHLQALESELCTLKS